LRSAKGAGGAAGAAREHVFARVEQPEGESVLPCCGARRGAQPAQRRAGYDGVLVITKD
jgi:hypothetical protein